MQLNPKHLTINGLLNGRLFRIPDYQRAYAWTEKQRSDLFDDIEEIKRTKQEHFMATVVCLAREKCEIVADAFQAVDVVDGQQRLTTIIILLKAIEKNLNKTNVNENNLKSEIVELLVKGDEHSVVLLQTNHDSSHMFIDYLRSGTIPEQEGVTVADQNIINAIN
jgi:uncharacterized protein with ParB-like and HNH nuclease domain